MNRLRVIPIARSIPAIILLFVACHPKTGAAPGPVGATAADAARNRWPDATPASLEQGRRLFLKACNTCHGYPEITALEMDEWPENARRMAAKSMLSPAEGVLVERYVTAVRKAPLGVPSLGPASPAPKPADRR